MNRYRSSAVTVVVLVTLTVAAGTLAGHDEQPTGRSRGTPRLISQSALLDGLAGKAVFPFVDTTPLPILRAHIAITDATAVCAPGAAPPANMQVLVGQAGVALVPVMTAATNTGISTTPAQCVFHVTIRPGAAGVPAVVTDIVVLNQNDAALSGINTITVTAEVR
jgi:hypothetical protein